MTMRKLPLSILIVLYFCNIAFVQDLNEDLSYYINQAEVKADSAQFVEALRLNQRALQIALSMESKPDSIISRIYTKLAFLYLERSNVNLSYSYFDKALNLRMNSEGEESRSVIKAYINLGYFKDEMNYYDEAIEYYTKAWHLTNKISSDENDPLLAIIFNNLALCYANENDFEKAIIYLKKTLAMDIVLYGNDHIDVAIDYHNIGSYYQELRKYDLSSQYYKKSLSIYKNKFPEYHPSIFSKYMLIGSNHFKLGDLEKAETYYDEVLALNIAERKEYKIHEINLYDHLGDLYHSKKALKKSLSYYKKAIKIIRQISERDDYYIDGSLLTKIGLVYADLKNYPKALFYLKKASYSIFDNKEPEASLESVKSPGILLDVYQAQLTTMLKYYNVVKKKKLLNEADQIGSKAIKLIEFMKRGYREEASKQFLVEDYYPIFEQSIEVKYKLWELTNDTIFTHQAFELAEKSKGSLLMEAIQKSNAERFSGIPDSLLKIKDQLRTDISFYEKLIFREEDGNNSPNLSLINKFNSKVFDLKLNYEEILKKIETEYPKYFKLRYSLNVKSVNQIRESLISEGQGLIEYFVGDSAIFVFALDGISFDMIRLEKNFPLEQWTKNLHSCISKYNAYSSTKDSLKRTYVELSNKIYEKIFEPILEYCPPRLTIIPDGVLNYLPFEALLKKTPPDIHKFRTYNYLLYDYMISYGFSASLLTNETPERDSALQKNLLAFAPEFKANTPYSVDRLQNLTPLVYNTKEAQQLQQMVGGTVFLGSDATEANFTKVADQYRILHLATHGMANDKLGDYSFLAFTEIEDSIENELLYVKDIYNLKLNADLVVLSACETAIGDLKRGEGMVSLARSFSYAGTPSILPTLWPVSDVKALQMMEFFYKNLQDGMAKDYALQQAKLRYINFNINLANHPFFWASFIVIGNTDPIHLPVVEEVAIHTSNNSNWPFVALGAILILLLIFFKKQQFFSLKLFKNSK